jgi:hypothetical protein
MIIVAGLYNTTVIATTLQIMHTDKIMFSSLYTHSNGAVSSNN